MRKTAGIIVLSAFLSLTVFTQNESFIYERDGKYYQGCEEFYPMIMNYGLYYEDSAGTFRIVPPMNHCQNIRGCNSCGTSRLDYRNKIASHLKTIVDMGFNTVRIVHLALHYDGHKDEDGNQTGKLLTNSYYKFNPDNPHCHKFYKIGLPLESDRDFRRQGDLMDQLFDIIREEQIPLKVMLLTGGHGIEVRNETYVDYLEYLADRFSVEPILFAYDFYNEPQYTEGLDPFAHDKYDRAKLFFSWYKAVKEIAPWHFVTYGPVLTDIFSWDPEVMPTDFFAYHLYSAPRENCKWSYDSAFVAFKVNLEYASRNFTKPWMLGETGLSGVDRSINENKEIHPIVSTEEEQRQFVEDALKYVKWYGLRGYAHWKFKDEIWSAKKLSTKTANQYFMGVLNYRENDQWKPSAFEFKKFDPDIPIQGCTHPNSQHYYNSFFYQYVLTEGYVFRKEGERNSPAPFKDALIRVTLGKPGNKEYNHAFLTFSDENGKFVVRANYKDKDLIIKQIRVSAPGMDQYYNSNWNIGVSLSSPIYLSALDPGSLPVLPERADVKEIGRGNMTWNRKTVLMEKTLVIEKGANLTIADTLFVMPGARIEVKEGGLLNLQGAIIGLCKWEGIDVLEGGKKGKKAGGDIVLGKGSLIKNSRYNIRRLNPDALLNDRDDDQ